MSISRLSPQKNHLLIIKAVKDLDVNLRIIGDGELKNELENLVKDLGIEDKVSFITSIPNNEIQDYYHTSDIFALAYDPKIEGVPIPVLEALASGMPIVIPKPVKELSDGLDDSVLFADLTPESFKEQFVSILKDDEKREELCKIALIKSTDFSIDKIENREKEIYQELLDLKKISIALGGRSGIAFVTKYRLSCT